LIFDGGGKRPLKVLQGFIEQLEMASPKTKESREIFKLVSLGIRSFFTVQDGAKITQ
jgi:hypothetical protein